MKKIFFITSLILATSLECIAQSKILVAYYSQNGTTQRAAQKIAELTGGRLFEIVPQTPYPSQHDPCLKQQMDDIKSDTRPPLKNTPLSLDDYDTIFVGYPIWYYQAPLVVNTFLELCRLDEKNIIPFCTSGGYPIENSVEKLKTCTPNAVWKKGLRVTFRKGEMEKWLGLLRE